MSDNPGAQLRSAREKQGISLEEVAQATRIRTQYLEAIEADELNRLPSQAHARGFIRTYARYLGLEAESLLSAMSGETSRLQRQDETGEPSAAAVKEGNSAGAASQAILEDLGARLRQHRETLGFSLEEVERSTRIRQHYLVAIETGNLDSLPSPVQGRGMLHNYATFLGLDPDEILLRYADGLQARLIERKGLKPARSTARKATVVRRPILQRLIPLDYILGGSLALFLLGFIIWAVMRVTSLNAAEEPQATIPSIVDALLATPEGSLTITPTLAETPFTATPGIGSAPEETEAPVAQETLESTLTLPGGVDLSAPIQVTITVLHRTWMRVTVDGKIEFEGRVLPGNAFAFAGDEQIELLTADGSALQVAFNQTDLGVLGVYGEVIMQVFTPEGLLLPTPTVTPTPTATTAVTPTLEATETPQATPAP